VRRRVQIPDEARTMTAIPNFASCPAQMAMILETDSRPLPKARRSDVMKLSTYSQSRSSSACGSVARGDRFFPAPCFTSQRWSATPMRRAVDYIGRTADRRKLSRRQSQTRSSNSAIASAPTWSIASQVYWTVTSRKSCETHSFWDRWAMCSDSHFRAN
jgi:Tfp pilus assembly protein PilV